MGSYTIEVVGMVHGMVHGIPGFAGRVVVPGDEAYDGTRRVWNAMHDRRPAAIALCTGASDVAAAIAYARRAGLPIAVRGGGHSLPGHGTCDGGLVIDLRLLSGVRVDPVARRAVVGGGALLGDLDRATQRHGQVVPAGVISHTGVGGLTLGGGVGRLMRRFGLTVDSLVGAEVVTADGRVLRAGESEHPDLFWALRGGGGNFGVVTEFEFRTHDLATPLVVLSMLHDLDDAPAVLRRAEREMSGGPDELLWTSFVRKAPPQPWVPEHLVGRPALLSVVEWSGPPEAARLADLAREVPPLASAVETVPFLQIQTAGDDVFGHGLLSYIKAGFALGLTDDLIEVLVKRGRSLGSPLTQIEVLAMGGAIGRVPAGATAFPHRDAAWLINVPASWSDPADSEREIDWVRQSFAELAPHCTGGAYINFMDGDETTRGGAGYIGTLRRLSTIKATYDAQNVFRLNQNIQPVPASPQGVANVGLHVADLDRSLRFYRDLLGLSVVHDSGRLTDPEVLALTATPGGAIRIVNLAGTGAQAATITVVQVDGVPRRPQPLAEFHDPGTMHVAMDVDSLETVLPRLRRAGVPLVAEPGGISGGGTGQARVVFLRDPDGFFLELVERRADDS